MEFIGVLHADHMRFDLYHHYIECLPMPCYVMHIITITSKWFHIPALLAGSTQAHLDAWIHQQSSHHLLALSEQNVECDDRSSGGRRPEIIPPQLFRTVVS